MKSTHLAITLGAAIIVPGLTARSGVPQDVSGMAAGDQNDQIRIECRLVRGDSLAELLGFDKKIGDEGSVYAVGFVLNDGSESAASVRLRVTVESKEYGGTCEVAVAVVPPGGRVGKPFLARLSAPLREKDLDLSCLKPRTEVLEVRKK